MLRSVLNQPSVARHVGHVLSALRELGAELTADPAVRDLAHGLQASATILRGEVRSPAEDHAYVNSHPHVSLVQALLEESAHNNRLSTRDDGTPPNVVPVEEPGRLARWRLSHPPETPFDDFEQWDIHWLEVVEEMVAYWRERIGFRLTSSPPTTFPLAADARIIVLSDWGNGSDVAWQVSEQARKWLGTAGDRECHVVHLGDIYYAGTEWEAQHRFLEFWPVEPTHPEHHHSWCLNGNHDMYAAGRGLRFTVLADERFALQRSTAGEVSTRLLLRGDDWQLIGLDSSWEFDLFDIGGPGSRAGRVALGPRAPVHHLPGHGSRGGSRTRVRACVGYSAMPEEKSTVATGPGEWEYPGLQPRDREGDVWRTCGFAVIDLDGQHATVTYVDQSGTPSGRIRCGPRWTRRDRMSQQPRAGRFFAAHVPSWCSTGSSSCPAAVNA